MTHDPTVCLALSGFWVAGDASKSLCVEIGEPLVVSVWEGLGKAPHVVRRHAEWVPRKEGSEDSPAARHRLGFLRVELGDVGLGTTYCLMLGYPNDDRTLWGEHDWRAFPEGGERSLARLFPEPGGSFYDAVLGSDDEYAQDMRAQEQSWVPPLSSYRPAADDESTRLTIALARLDS